MNRKGFTVVEFIVSFCLASTISFLLFEIIINFKDLYIKGNIETAFETKKSNILKLINSDLLTKEVYEIKSCGEDCVEFVFSDNITKKLEIKKNIIKYDNYSIKMINGTTIGKIETSNLHSTTTDNQVNSLFKVNIPIKNKLSDKKFDISFVYLYDNSSVNVTY